MSMHRRMRTITPVLPTEMDAHRGLAYSLWLPEAGRSAVPDAGRSPIGGIVILHGAGSCKENHHDFARAALAAGFAALAFDQPGHGDSQGPMDGGVLGDPAAM